MDRIDPTFFDDETVRAALAARDVGRVYRLLQRIGVTQRRIAALTGQSQSEVNEILHKSLVPLSGGPFRAEKWGSAVR